MTPRPSSCRADLMDPTQLSAVNVQGVFRVSCMTVLCLPPFPELASLASKSARMTPLESGHTLGRQPSEGPWPSIHRSPDLM